MNLIQKLVLGVFGVPLLVMAVYKVMMAGEFFYYSVSPFILIFGLVMLFCIFCFVGDSRGGRKSPVKRG